MSTGQTGHCQGIGAARWALVDSRIALDMIPGTAGIRAQPLGEI